MHITINRTTFSKNLWKNSINQVFYNYIFKDTPNIEGDVTDIIFISPAYPQNTQWEQIVSRIYVSIITLISSEFEALKFYIAINILKFSSDTMIYVEF